MASTTSLKMQNPDAWPRIAWCRPPAMLTACSTSPLHTCSAARAEPPAISADASYMPAKTGSSLVPSP